MENEPSSNTSSPDIRFIRLSLGDDLLAEMIEETDTTVIVSHTMTVIVDLEPDLNKQTVIIYPWIPSGVSKSPMANVTLKKSDIVIITEIEDDMKESYLGMRNSTINNAKTNEKIKKTLKTDNVLSFDSGGKKNRPN